MKKCLGSIAVGIIFVELFDFQTLKKYDGFKWGDEMQESGENYLEMILILQGQNGRTRSIDVAKALSVSKPSVSRAVSKLKKEGYLLTGEKGYLQLTESGLEIAERIYERHRFLTEFFMNIGVSEPIAVADACRVEHVISQETFLKWKDAYQK